MYPWHQFVWEVYKAYRIDLCNRMADAWAGEGRGAGDSRQEEERVRGLGRRRGVAMMHRLTLVLLLTCAFFLLFLLPLVLLDFLCWGSLNWPLFDTYYETNACCGVVVA